MMFNVVGGQSRFYFPIRFDSMKTLLPFFQATALRCQWSLCFLLVVLSLLSAHELTCASITKKIIRTPKVIGRAGMILEFQT